RYRGSATLPVGVSLLSGSRKGPPDKAVDPTTASGGGAPDVPQRRRVLLNQRVPTAVVKAPRQPTVSRKHRLSGLRRLLAGMRCDGCRRDASRRCKDEAE